MVATRAAKHDHPRGKDYEHDDPRGKSRAWLERHAEPYGESPPHQQVGAGQGRHRRVEQAVQQGGAVENGMLASTK